MTNENDNKIISIETIRINYARNKICKCDKPLYEIDYNENGIDTLKEIQRIVGAFVDK